jgi:glutamate N-acetyltransferase/amino-acid N-acetyltransferase
MSAFFASRWVDVPEGLTEVAGGGLPQGFRAAGVACGLKADGGLDLGLLVSDAPNTVSAVRFTRSGVLAAPVLVTQQRARLDALRVVAANSGNANAATGNRGLDEAARMQGAAAMAGRTESERVAVCSTGVIGVQLDGRKVVAGLRAASSELEGDDASFAAAIMTTDKFEKRVTLELQLSGGPIRLSAQAKGAGMIQPAFATLLCFVQTDAALTAVTADLLLGVCVKRSFDRISVDGQLSTNDTVILQASGASGVRVAPESTDELAFGQALDALLRQLALLIVKDGEGARRVGRVVVRGEDSKGVDHVARAIANSPLVKTALYGGDPNWGRIAQSIGMALPHSAPLSYDITIEGMRVAGDGQALAHDTAELALRVAADEVEYEVALQGDGAETEVFFSDLGHEYITINAEYTT